MGSRFAGVAAQWEWMDGRSVVAAARQEGEEEKGGPKGAEEEKGAAGLGRRRSRSLLPADLMRLVWTALNPSRRNEQCEGVGEAVR